MKNLLDTSKCPSFEPSFSDTECSYYEFAETESMEPAIGECGYCKRPGAYRCVADVARVVPLSHSSIDTFLTCHYLYYLKKILGIEMRPPFFGPALKAGRLWDVIKQRHLGAAISIKDTIEEYEIDPLTVAKVRALYHGYKEFDIQVEPGHTLQAPVDIKLPIKVPAVSFTPAVTKENKDTINLWLVRDKLSDNDTEWLFELSVSGFYDRKYPTYFCEDKLSSRPEYYLDPFFIQSQNGTYFLADENLEYCVQEVVQFPQQRPVKKKNESADELYERVLSDVISKPSKYFIGFDRKKKMYGKKFYRGEFDIDAIKARYQQVALEIMSCRWTGNYYKNFKSCNNILPGIPCDMKTVCSTGNVSENMFRVRDKR